MHAKDARGNPGVHDFIVGLVGPKAFDGNDIYWADWRLDAQQNVTFLAIKPTNVRLADIFAPKFKAKIGRVDAGAPTLESDAAAPWPPASKTLEQVAEELRAYAAAEKQAEKQPRKRAKAMKNGEGVDLTT